MILAERDFGGHRTLSSHLKNDIEMGNTGQGGSYQVQVMQDESALES